MTAELDGRTAVVTGGTSGIGLATALALARQGAAVHVVGRSPEKVRALESAPGSGAGGGTLRPMATDLSRLSVARETAEQLATEVGHLDFVVNSAGILITRTAHTDEGLELDFAVSYLARVVFVEELHRMGAIDASSRILTISAAGPKVPRFARVEFDNLDKVRARTGMRSHGQAQAANDLWTAQAGHLYGCVAIAYGPGAVNTSIRREVPGWIQRLIAPFFARSTREPAEVATQLLEILTDPELKPGTATFANRSGYFRPDSYVADERRQADLMETTRTLIASVPRTTGSS